MNVLELSSVSKRFGERTVLCDLSLTVPEGSIYGFIGENGAGKTTTMKIITGLLASDGGEIRICGEKVSYGQTRTNRFVGYLPDVPEFYGYLTAREYLLLVGGLAGLTSGELNKRADELLELVGLSDSASRRIGGFSRGMKQRLGIAQAFDPRRQFGEHADRGDVEGVALQMRLEHGFGVVKPSFDQRQRRRHQRGVADPARDRCLRPVGLHPQPFFRALAIAWRSAS